MCWMLRRHWGGLEDVRKRLRQLMHLRRVVILVLCLFLVLYIFISLIHAPVTTTTDPCIASILEEWKPLEDEFLVSTTSSRLPVFAGNGFIGIGDDDDGELRIVSPATKVLSGKVGLFPLIGVSVPGATSAAKATVVDYRNGYVKMYHCFTVNDDCACVTRTVYAHRARPHVFVQDITTRNPTGHPINIKLETNVPKNWRKGESVDKTSVYSTVVTVDGAQNAIAAVCSYVPDEIVVQRRREESERFICIINYDFIKPNDQAEGEYRMRGTVSKEFADVLNIPTTALDQEHDSAWRDLNKVTFGISKSLAPGVLNPEVINATRYGLLSNVRAFLLEHVISPERKKEILTLMYRRKESSCYSEHSTFVVPRTALWKITGSVDDLVKAVSVWILTLEKSGCANLVRAGATGVAQAFVLSLIAGKMTPLHLEIKLEPIDLHREITAEGIAISEDGRLSISFKLDHENRPYMVASSTSQVYACDAGCFHPSDSLINENRVFPVKLTKPLTPILYVSENRLHLQQLRNTIHVVEVINAPPHEQELIALHKHGHRLGGLPIGFWILLGTLVVIFHLFLFKLLYSEWKKADYTPYNYYLRQRYARTH